MERKKKSTCSTATFKQG